MELGEFEKKLSGLVKTVFGTDKGQELLKTLSDLYYDGEIMSDLGDYIELGKQLGKRELLKDIKYYLKITSAELDKVYEKVNSDFNVFDDDL